MKPPFLTLGLLALMTYFPVEEARKDVGLLNLVDGTASAGVKIGISGSIKTQGQDSIKSKPKASSHQASSTSTSSQTVIYLNSPGQKKLRPSKSYCHSAVILHPHGQRQWQQNIRAQQRKRVAKSFSNKIPSKGCYSAKSPIYPPQKEGEGRFTQIQTVLGPSKFHSNVAIQGKGAQATIGHDVPQMSGQSPYNSRLSAQKKSYCAKFQQFGQSKPQLDASSQQNLSQRKPQPRILTKGKISQHKPRPQMSAHSRQHSQQHNPPQIILTQQKTQKKTFGQRPSQAKQIPQGSSQRKPGQRKLHSQKSAPKKLRRHENQPQTSASSKVIRFKHRTNTNHQERPGQPKRHSNIFIQKRLGRGKLHPQILVQGSSDQHKGNSQIWTKGKTHTHKHPPKKPVKGRTGQPTRQQKNPKLKIPGQHRYHPQKHVPRKHSSIHFHHLQISQRLQPDIYNISEDSSMDWSHTSHHYDPNPSVHNQPNSHHPRGNPKTSKTKNKSYSDIVQQSATADKKLTANKSTLITQPNTSIISAATSLVSRTSDATTSVTNAAVSSLPVFVTKSAVTDESASTPSSATMTAITTAVADTSASSAAKAGDTTYCIPTSSPTRPIINIPYALSTSASSLPTSEEAVFSLHSSTSFIPDVSSSTDALNTIPANSIPADTRSILAGAIHADTSHMSLGSKTSDLFDDTSATTYTSSDSTETTSGAQSVIIPDLTNFDEVSTVSISTIPAGTM